MKKQLLFALALMISLAGFSQIEMKTEAKETQIGKAKQGGLTLAELSYTIEDKDTTYRLFCRNQKYQTISDFYMLTFTEDGGVLNSLYDVLMSVFKDENRDNKDYKVSFKLGAKDVSVSNYRVMGVTGAWLWFDGKYTVLTEKQVNKLFGKS